MKDLTNEELLAIHKTTGDKVMYYHAAEGGSWGDERSERSENSDKHNRSYAEINRRVIYRFRAGNSIGSIDDIFGEHKTHETILGELRTLDRAKQTIEELRGVNKRQEEYWRNKYNELWKQRSGRYA